jgi:hypothetical protein
LKDSVLLQSLKVELLRVRQFAHHADNPLLVYFIEMAIQQLKSNSYTGADGAVAGDGEQSNPIENEFARFE